MNTPDKPDKTVENLTSEQYLKFEILVPLVCEIVMKRQLEKEGLIKADSSGIYKQAITQLNQHYKQLFESIIPEKWELYGSSESLAYNEARAVNQVIDELRSELNKKIGDK